MACSGVMGDNDVTVLCRNEREGAMTSRCSDVITGKGVMTSQC